MCGHNFLMTSQRLSSCSPLSTTTPFNPPSSLRPPLPRPLPRTTSTHTSERQPLAKSFAREIGQLDVSAVHDDVAAAVVVLLLLMLLLLLEVLA